MNRNLSNNRRGSRPRRHKLTPSEHYKPPRKPEPETTFVRKWHGRQLHCDDEPAEIAIDEHGNVTLEIWYQYGKIHRPDGPAYTHRDAYGTRFEYIIYNGIRSANHRVDGPAIETIFYNGVVGEQVWVINGNVSRLGGGPAIERRNEDNKLLSQFWQEDGQYHRAGGPARIKYYSGWLEWWEHDRRGHSREMTPAESCIDLSLVHVPR